MKRGDLEHVGAPAFWICAPPDPALFLAGGTRMAFCFDTIGRARRGADPPMIRIRFDLAHQGRKGDTGRPNGRGAAVAVNAPGNRDDWHFFKTVSYECRRGVGRRRSKIEGRWSKISCHARQKSFVHV